MKSYPISVNRQTYRGADPRRRASVAERNRIAQKVEAYLNRELSEQANDTVHVYASCSVAAKIDEDSDAVHDIIHATDAGANGITIFKGNYQ